MLDLKSIEERIGELRTRQKALEILFGELGVTIDKNTQSRPKTFLLKTTNLKNLKVACIMDRFTLDSYSPECKLLQLTPTEWKSELQCFCPDMLFIESAWQGKDGLWYRKIANGSKELFELACYCHDNNIPIIFWNKEDPIYTDTFMPAARLADFVFTTDIDCIGHYKQLLQHDRVYHLHFAAQPEQHNPIEKYSRKDKYCFAGAYYHRYPKRAEIFNKFSKVFIDSKGLDIYDRNFKNALPEHAFPKEYDSYILGNLDPSDIDMAYKGYYYGINMNSVSQSQTMFARRVFEMIASNTITIGNYSRGVKNYFGDLTICTDDNKELEHQLSKYCADVITLRKYRLVGLRKVLQYNLYEDRLNYIVKQVYGVSLKKVLPQIFVIIYGNTRNTDRLISLFKNQTYKNKKLIVIGDGRSESDICFISKDKTLETKLRSFGENNIYFSFFHEADYYGKNYLLDLALTLRYYNGQGIGKSCYYVNDSDSITKKGDLCHTPVRELEIRRGIFSLNLNALQDKTIDEFLSMNQISGSHIISIDEFNYCMNFQGLNCTVVDDLSISDQGIDIGIIEKAAEDIKFNAYLSDGFSLSANEMFQYIHNKQKDISIRLNNANLNIDSSLSDKENKYVYFEKQYKLEDMEQKDGKLNILYMGDSSMEVLGVILFLDENLNKISPVFPKLSVFTSYEIPKGTKYLKFGIRIRGMGHCKLDQIRVGLDEVEHMEGCFLSRSNVLVLSNQYPSYDNLYRNMFVHKRLLAYKEDNYVFDAMRMNIYAKEEYSEFEGINIVEGQSAKLAHILSKGYITTVCVHFLDKQMWEVLKQFPQLRILVWVHGAEIQPWWRREYNYTTKEELERAKKDSEVRMNFWKEVFSCVDEYNIHFIFVSKYFSEEIFDDNNITLPQSKYSIIHNCIDTQMFNYIEKDPEQRKKILSIRPYANRKYANDLTVKAILELSKTSCFNDMNFTLIGNGDLFEETVKPLKKFNNVTLLKTFLRQEEISEYHKHYGIFITPTRMDAQGVSRDEAMSSGLVPVTNAVTAIPEFVDNSCGILAPAEDYLDLAKGIERLYFDPELYINMSENAAKRVRIQSSKEFTIDKEEQLIMKNK